MTIEVKLRRLPAHVCAIGACVLALLASANGASATTPASSTHTSAPFHLGGNPLPPAAPPVETAAPTGPYRVGLRTQDYRFHGYDLMLFFWYPAHHSPHATPYVTDGGIRGQAVVNAPLDRSGAEYPLILFSPGLGAPGDGYYFYEQNLASHGYIVVSVSGIDSTEAALGSNAREAALVNYETQHRNASAAVELEFSDWFRSTQLGFAYRPREAEFALDTALKEDAHRGSWLFHAINTKEIGMSGHSLGAFTTLLLGGMGVDCKVPLTAGELNLGNPVIIDINPCAEPKVKALRRPTALADPRIKAMIALAPPFFSLKDRQIAAGTSDIGIPTMIITGLGSQFESTLAPQVETYRGIHSPKYLVEVKGTSHLLVSDDYQFNPVLENSLPTSDRTNFGAKARVYEDYSVAFFNRYLKGEQRRTAATLDHPTSSFVAALRHSDG